MYERPTPLSGQPRLDAKYRVSILRTLAYLFTHPEVECHIKWENTTAQNIGDRQTFSISVDGQAFWRANGDVHRRFGDPRI